MSGSFVWTLTSVDIVSGWSEVRPVWNRGQHTTRQGIEAITEAQPFDLKGIDSDNGGEFLNHHLHPWSQEKGIKEIRRHAKTNRTPAQRLIDGGKISLAQRAWLEEQMAGTNPFEMKQEIEERLRKFWELVAKLDRQEAEKRESVLAEEGPPPLRSGSPSSAREQSKNQVAMVSP